MTRERMSVRQWAADRGVSSSTAGRAALTGRIRRGPDGLVDGGQADADFEQNRLARSDSPTPRVGRGRGNGAGRGTAGRPRSPASTSLAAEQAALVRARRERIEFDMEKERGLWVLEVEVQRATRERLQRHRDQLQILPSRLAHLCHEKNAGEVERILSREIRTALADLARAVGVPAT